MFFNPNELGKAVFEAFSASVSPPSPDSPVLVDKYGNPTNSIAVAWGCTYDTCLRYSNQSTGWTFITWNLFAPMFSTWLIPWFALTAQLPFETKDHTTDLMALLLMLGSPMLAIYSLCLAVLNARWIRKVFTTEQEKWQHEDLHEAAGHRLEAIQAAKTILVEMQHVPIQIIKGPYNDFAQSVVRPENSLWWSSLLKEILKTKRTKTLSLQMQLAWVLGTYVLSIIQFFTTAADENSVVLGLAVASLWVWMLPVAWGWVFVGTQNFARSINTALNIVSAPNITDEAGKVQARCQIIKDRSDENMDQDMDCLWSFPITGWEQEPGPLFTYARIWSYLTACEHVRKAWHILAQKELDFRTVDGELPWDSKSSAANLMDSSDQIAEYIFQDQPFLFKNDFELGVHSGPPKITTRNILVATIVAFTLQWSTTGGAILIAYNAPPAGLGCDSGSYLFYGIAATVAWSLLSISSWISHLWAKRRELGNTRRPSLFSLGSVAVLTRVAGNTVAVCNALWVILLSFLQFTNLYSNCWCAASVLQWGSQSWVLLYASDSDIFEAMKGYSISGTFLALSMAIICMIWVRLAKGDVS